MKPSKCILLGLAFASVAGCDIIYPKERAERFLEGKGYTVTGGGEKDFVNSCGDNFARNFRVKKPDGTATTKTVCYGLIMRIPIIE